VVSRSRDQAERLARRGVVVRDCASFGLDGHVRIAVPDGAGLARLDRALAALDDNQEER
jgi:histidinol-phosphate/aromatic aminotransferase/cobyric acid decarboxylase-like protein